MTIDEKSYEKLSQKLARRKGFSTTKTIFDHTKKYEWTKAIFDHEKTITKKGRIRKAITTKTTTNTTIKSGKDPKQELVGIFTEAFYTSK